jgi:hypothetical protein
MRKTAKFFALSRSDRTLLLSAVVTMLVMRTAMWTLNFARVRRIADAMSRRVRVNAERPSAERIAWAVATTSRVVPRGSNCLVRALATGIVLNRHGYPNELKIGVMKPAGGGFEAHAWLESEGRVLIGDFQLDQYVPLASSDAAHGDLASR